MELLLNEKSLDGQFTSLDEFYSTLPEMSRNLRILKEQGILLLKHSTLYQRKITDDISLLDLQNSKGTVAPVYRDQVKQWKRELSMLSMSPPYWDGEENGNTDSLMEAALRKTNVLSFAHKDYTDVTLHIACQEQEVSVKSAVSTNYLLNMLWQGSMLDLVTYLRHRYAKGRIALDYLDSETESMMKLEKAELEDTLTALDRFNAAESWQAIWEDRFFFYKSYKPKSKKEDYFTSSRFSGKQIDKFRCGQHSQVRCFGYRENDRFYVLMMERDHSVSDTG